MAADEWRSLAPVPLPNPRFGTAANYRKIETIPVLGGNYFYFEGDARVGGVRLALLLMPHISPTKSDAMPSHANAEGARHLLPRTPKNEQSQNDAMAGVNRGGDTHFFARLTTRAPRRRRETRKPIVGFQVLGAGGGMWLFPGRGVARCRNIDDLNYHIRLKATPRGRVKIGVVPI